MAAVEEITPQKKGPSLVVQLAVLLGLTAAAVGAGWLSGQHLNATQRTPAAPKAADEAKPAEPAPGTVAAGSLYPLPAITTNLAGTGETWVRMEAVLVFDGEADSAMAEFVHQDILAFLRTITLRQVEGASGFQHLKMDLEERAQIRSGGKVKSILIRTLLFE